MTKLLLTLSALLLTQSAIASVGSQSFVYHGQVLSAGGTTPVTQKVDVLFDILAPNGCLLFEEKQLAFDLSLTNGKLTALIGSGVRTALDSGLVMSDIFSNLKVIGVSTNCPSGYTPTAGDTKTLHVSIAVNGGAMTAIAPDVPLGSVPSSFSADTLQGLKPIDVVTPAGTIITFSGYGCPSGYIAASGGSVLTTSYPALSAAYKSGSTSLYGAPDSTHFNIPNLNGSFLRGSGSQSYGLNYNGGNVGDKNQDTLQGHKHSFPGPVSTQIVGSNFQNIYSNGGIGQISSTNGADTSDGGNGIPRVSAETRPFNSTVNFCLKY